MNSFTNQAFYTIKPLIPRLLQIALRRQAARYKRKRHAHIWPIDPNAGTPPAGWAGWPDGKQFAFVLSHDVDTRKGYNNVIKLAKLEESMGFRSQFNFVPERYGQVSIEFLDELKRRGFGIGVHGLKHDGKLFSSRKIFNERASRINFYLREWKTRSFTTPSMIRNHYWMHDLEIDFCTSTFDTDPFEPQSEGSGTIFPFWIGNRHDNRRFLELPYTLPQDFTLFVILKEKDNMIWERKLDWIASKGGLALLNSHPDYMSFNGSDSQREEYPIRYYQEFLMYIKKNYDGKFFHAVQEGLLDDKIIGSYDVKYC